MANYFCSVPDGLRKPLGILLALPPMLGTIVLMAGTTAITLPKKLGIKPGHTVVLLDAPAGFIRTFEVPEATRISQQLRHPAIDVMIVFATSLHALEGRFSKLASKMHPEGGLWIAYPSASGLARRTRRLTDITDELIRRIGLAAGMNDNKACDLGAGWSAIRLVTRLENRDAVAYRTILAPNIAARRLRRATLESKVLPWRATSGGAGSALRRARASRAK